MVAIQEALKWFLDKELDEDISNKVRLIESAEESLVGFKKFDMLIEAHETKEKIAMWELQVQQLKTMRDNLKGDCDGSVA